MKTLFIMPMSLGDILEVSAVLGHYKGIYPSEELYLMCKKKYQWILEGCDWIKLVDYPDPFWQPNFIERNIKNYTICKQFDRVIELNHYTQIETQWCIDNLFPANKSRREHYCDLAGVEFNQDDMPYFPDYACTYIKGELILIHPYPAMDEGRMWDKWEELVIALKKIGWKNIAQIGVKSDKLVDGVMDFRSIPYMDFLRLIKCCDYFIGCDSFPLHVAGAMNKKGVALWGNTYKPYAMSWPGRIRSMVAPRNCSDEFPCHQGFCKAGKKCIKNIEVGEVLYGIRVPGGKNVIST